jgi:hypothetical protein
VGVIITRGVFSRCSGCARHIPSKFIPTMFFQRHDFNSVGELLSLCHPAMFPLTSLHLHSGVSCAGLSQHARSCYFD